MVVQPEQKNAFLFFIVSGAAPVAARTTADSGPSNNADTHFVIAVSDGKDANVNPDMHNNGRSK